MSEYKKYAERNPNMLFFATINIHMRHGLDELPENSDFWLRDVNGQVIKNEVPWDEYTLDILNPEVQQLVIEQVVGIAECGYFSGVYFDAWAPYHIGVYEKHFNIDAEVVIEAYINILKGIRARVRDDFLILVNRNRRKSPRYAEWINGSRMETDVSYPGGYTYERLIEAEDALLWNEKHLREPRINILEADGVANQPPDGPDNLRWMRVWTTLSLTHSDGYSILRMPGEYGKYKEVPGVYQQYGDHTWYDFYDADLGKPVGEKGQRCDGCAGLFIREFTNGWAVYNRSGQPQKIQFLTQVIGVASGITNTTHIIPDLDGEMYLKHEPDTIVDGTVKVLELELAIEDPSEWIPDAVLQAVVREALEELGLPASAPLTKEKMLQLTSLKANHRGIVDITGLEFALSLKDLNLGGRNRITDLRPLANLTNLTQLHIWHRELAGMPPVTNLDISPISGLVNLERLSLENNGISDINPLAGLKKLKLLGLSDNTIEDLSPLVGLKKLQHLNLSDNSIKDLSPLAELTNLRELWIENNPATDFSPLAALNLTDFRSDVDVNDDGVVNIQDLVIVANALGKAEPDLNGDGVVNIQDLVIVANAF
ncbi:MAG: leucine-rich repeat domain-containing protein [Candidatus Poribacteria bacterium]|nr:leucine-rich repeat domain-containing protein [Candidatus Poribacteria bacterium]